MPPHCDHVNHAALLDQANNERGERSPAKKTPARKAPAAKAAVAAKKTGEETTPDSLEGFYETVDKATDLCHQLNEQIRIASSTRLKLDGNFDAYRKLTDLTFQLNGLRNLSSIFEVSFATNPLLAPLHRELCPGVPCKSWAAFRRAHSDLSRAFDTDILQIAANYATIVTHCTNKSLPDPNYASPQSWQNADAMSKLNTSLAMLEFVGTVFSSDVDPAVREDFLNGIPGLSHRGDLDLKKLKVDHDTERRCMLIAHDLRCRVPPLEGINGEIIRDPIHARVMVKQKRVSMLERYGKWNNCKSNSTQELVSDKTYFLG